MGYLYEKLARDMTGRNKDSRKVGNNTYKVRRDDAIAIRLHQTDVVTVFPDDSIKLDSGGWRTVTTKERMNAWLPTPWHLWTEKGVWYLGRRSDDTYLYADGIVIEADGTVIGAIPHDPDYDKLVNQLKKRVREYAALYVEHLPLPAPGSGDCWYCLMRDENGVTMGDFSGKHDRPDVREILSIINAGDAEVTGNHLIGHIIEGYVVPSLAYNALKEFGASQVEWWTAFSPEFYEAGGWGDSMHDHMKREIAKHVYKYVIRRFGFGV